MSSDQVPVLDPALVDQIREYAWEQQLGLTVWSCDHCPIVLHSTSLHDITTSPNVLHPTSPCSGNLVRPRIADLRLLRDLVSTYCCDPAPLETRCP